jgi:hypothetical protein
MIYSAFERMREKRRCLGAHPSPHTLASTNMDTFKCMNCHQESTESGSISWLGRFGLLILTRSVVWPQRVCVACAKKLSALGTTVFVIVAALLLAAYVFRW